MREKLEEICKSASIDMGNGCYYGENLYYDDAEECLRDALEEVDKYLSEISLSESEIGDIVLALEHTSKLKTSRAKLLVEKLKYLQEALKK